MLNPHKFTGMLYLLSLAGYHYVIIKDLEIYAYPIKIDKNGESPLWNILNILGLGGSTTVFSRDGGEFTHLKPFTEFPNAEYKL